MRAFLLVLFCSAAVPICCGEGEVRVLAGGEPLAPGEELQLDFFWNGDRTAAPWYVDGVEGGDATAGTVTAAGLYTAPAVPPDHDPVVEAVVEGYGCADCCTAAARTVRLLR